MSCRFTNFQAGVVDNGRLRNTSATPSTTFHCIRDYFLWCANNDREPQPCAPALGKPIPASLSSVACCIPFTCSFLPGKSLVHLAFLAIFALFYLLVLLSSVELAARHDGPRCARLLMLLTAAALLARWWAAPPVEYAGPRSSSKKYRNPRCRVWDCIATGCCRAVRCSSERNKAEGLSYRPPAPDSIHNAENGQAL
jgi:hypothetical protein